MGAVVAGVGLLLDKGLRAWGEGPGRDTEDRLRPTPVPITALQSMVPFKVREFVHWVPRIE